MNRTHFSDSRIAGVTFTLAAWVTFFVIPLAAQYNMTGLAGTVVDSKGAAAPEAR